MNTAVPPGRVAAAPVLASAAATQSTPSPRSLATTAGLPEGQQFDAWREQVVPFLDIEAPQHTAGFDAEATTLRFGPFLLYAARLPAYDYARSAQRIRRDSLDHWMIGFCRRGTQRQRSGDTVLDFRPGVPHVLSMAQPFEARRAGEQVEWIALHLPRDALPTLEPGFEAMLNQPLAGAPGGLLTDFLGGIADRLDTLVPADLPYLATAAEALLAASLRAGASIAFAPGIERLQLARVKRLIRDNIGQATLRPGRLAGMVGMSRSQLYRLFEPHGGVAQFIQRERLRQARRLLGDPEERRDIATLAEAAGFFDPSSFSRAFRREFGCTPREHRLAALSGAPGGQEPPCGVGLPALLRAL
ncbi:AraC family transcriptional regulator [Roseomonas rosulenta]|uniref:AraC family transcriptional regulator n=1 Tax=Roseomonas rosulenta TaxID=2748667 RepID=UPI0018DF0AFC|nr:AraC family transcriptional regulator [Roseomonas rosulenta]